MKCCFCGKEIVDDAVYCSYCGKKVVSSTDFKKNAYTIIKEFCMELVPHNVDINKYLNPVRLTTMKEIFYVFCVDLQDYNMMPSVIGFLRDDRKEAFRKILCDFDKDKIIENYNIDTLYNRFCESFPVKNKNSKVNLWRKYARAIIDAANYLKDYNTAIDYYCSIDENEDNLEAANQIAKSIHGAGFPIACNILKDIGYTNIAKPDVHIKDVLSAIGFPNDDMGTIKAIQDIANANNDTAFNLDRMIWLICSGYYFHDDIKIGSHKAELIYKLKNNI